MVLPAPRGATGSHQRPRRKEIITMKRTTVGDVMTTRVVAVKRDASFKEMIIRMREFRGRSDDS